MYSSDPALHAIVMHETTTALEVVVEMTEIKVTAVVEMIGTTGVDMMVRALSRKYRGGVV